MRPFLDDQYAALGFKAAVGDGVTSLPTVTAPTWVRNDDARRLAAYSVLGAYRRNVAVNYLPDVLDEKGNLVDLRVKYREYGHAGVLVQQTRALLLGEEQTIVVPDARVADDAPATEMEKAKAAQVVQDWLTAWAEEEGLLGKLYAAEWNALGDGDGVLVLGWDPAKRRPRVKKYDPGFYFPDLRASSQDDFPHTVHVAWEYRDGDRVFLERQTWRLVPLDTPTRRAYHAKDAKVEQLAQFTCLYSHGVWDVAELRGQTVYTLTDQGATWKTDPDGKEMRDVDLGVDFIPVIHLRNDVDEEAHFGTSILLLVAQILDDIAATDSDLQANSALVGSPPVVTSGAPGALAAGPGAQWGVDAKLLDTSRSLDALLKYDEHLLDVLSVNSRMAAALIGRLKPNEVPSGYAMQLGFAATRALIRELRLTRRRPHGLLLKFGIRLAQVGGVLPAGEAAVARLELGSFLPADKAAAVDHVKALLPVHGMSVRTAVQELIQVGFAIEDAKDEVARILAEWGALAVQAVEATGDVAVGRKILGLDVLPAVPPAPEPTPDPAA